MAGHLLPGVPGYYHHGDFAHLLDREPTGGGTGFYEWATTADKSPAFQTVAPELAKRPAVKAIVYFDTERDDEGDRNISITSTPQALTTFRDLAANPIFNVNLR